LRTWPKLGGFSFQFFGECRETIFEGSILFESATLYGTTSCFIRRAHRFLQGNHRFGAVLPSKRQEGFMRVNRERLTRAMVGAMLTMVSATSAVFGVARHFAG
jgi:hypothetical protein